MRTVRDAQRTGHFLAKRKICLKEEQDIHKKVPMVVVATASEKVGEDEVERIEYESRRFGSGAGERQHLVAWMRERKVEEVVMESTAQYYFSDAKRLTRRLLASELILSFVPDAEQRAWRTMTRSRQQLVRDRVRL